MSVFEDINCATKLHDYDLDNPSSYGRGILDFIAYHFDLRPLTPAAKEAVKYAGSKDVRVFRSDDPVKTGTKKEK